MKKVFNKFLSIVLVLSVLCGSLSFDVVQASSKIALNKTSVSLKVGKTCKLKVSGTTKTVKWSSKKKSVATVSQTGKVTAKKAGTTTIVAKVSGKTLKCKVTVKSVSHTVYITKTGKRYHYDNHCNGGTYYKSTLAEAKRLGLTPCEKCVK